MGPFPESFTFGDTTVTAETYDPAKAKELLKNAGWTDTDGDGYVDKNGKKLTIRWVTYPSRQELPLLAESVQATMKNIGIDIQVNSTANYQDYLDKGDWDIFAGAFVSAPTGDPEYFFTSCTLDESASNNGHYHSDKLEDLEKQIRSFDEEKNRARIMEHHQQMGSYESGHACEAVCSWIKQKSICEENA